MMPTGFDTWRLRMPAEHEVEAVDELPMWSPPSPEACRSCRGRYLPLHRGECFNCIDDQKEDR